MTELMGLAEYYTMCGKLLVGRLVDKQLGKMVSGNAFCSDRLLTDAGDIQHTTCFNALCKCQHMGLGIFLVSKKKQQKKPLSIIFSGT